MPPTAPNPTITLTIAGVPFKHSLRYAPGHMLNEAEARALNIVLNENIRRNFRPKVDKANEHAVGPVAVALALQAEFSTYANSYQFGSGTVTSTDPVDRLARQLARDAIKASCRAKGIDPSSKGEAWLEAQISANVDHNPRFKATAQQRIDDARAAASEVLEGFELEG